MKKKNTNNNAWKHVYHFASMAATSLSATWNTFYSNDVQADVQLP